MFFGGGSKETENLKLEELADALTASFNKKLVPLDAKASRIVRSINDAIAYFQQACDEFRELKKEPDTDFIRATSITYVMEQKNTYLNVLAKIIAANAQHEKEHYTVYDKYYDHIEQTGALLNEVLRANQQFKMVLDAYPNHLSNFKRAFSAIETQWRVLKAEVEARNRETQEYQELLGIIQSISALKDELGISIKSLEDLEKQASRKVEEEEVRQIEQKADAIRNQNRAMDKKASELNAEVSVILSAIGKPARKHDYIALYKPKLTPLLDNPLLLRTNSKYEEFYKHVEEMRQEMASGSIALKNADEVSHALSAVLDGRFKSLIDNITELEANKHPLETELRELERMEQELKDVMNGSYRRERMLIDIKNRIVEIKAQREKNREKAESLFDIYYKRRIKITL